MLPQTAMNCYYDQGYACPHFKHKFDAGPQRKVYVSRPAIRENILKKKKHPTCVVIDEFGEKHFYHAVKVEGFLGFDPHFEYANVYLLTDKSIYCYLDENGDPPFEIDNQEQKPTTIASKLWSRLMGFRRRVRHACYAFFWGVGQLPGVNCLIDTNDYQPYRSN